MQKLLSKQISRQGRDKKGFTLIELLVVIAIIGLLSTLAVVSLNSARQKARDAKRVGDIKQIQTALELYFSDKNEYPIDDGSDGYNLGKDVTCLGSGGFGTAGSDECVAPVFMGLVPSDPDRDLNYNYISEQGGGNGHCSDDDTQICVTYSITFELEGKAGGLEGPATFTANPNGIQ